MSNRPKEMTPFVTPDSFRQLLNTYKKMYDLHTNRNFGLEDTGGLQYSGTVENFGSELLLESNKLRLNKPPIGSLDICDTFKFFFNMKFVEGISDYAGNFMYHTDDRFFKQNMVCCLLKKDRINTNVENYLLTFSDIKLTFVLGSESTSDSNVRRMAFFTTTTPPTLSADDDNVSLTVDDGSDIDTVYYFPLNKMTYDILGIESDSDIYHIETEGTFTINLRECIDNNPYIWFCVDRFRVLPDIILNNNVSISGDPLLIPGIDGNDIMHLYPSAGVTPSIPDIEVDTDVECEWFIKAYGDFKYKIIDGVKTLDTGEITKIQYLYADKVNCETPVAIHDITCENPNYKICPFRDITESDVHTPQPGEYDYDPSYYKNTPYIFMMLSDFDGNEPTSIIDDSSILDAAFTVKVDEKSYVDYYEKDMNKCVSGIHVDYTTDRSDNNVDKIRGTVHDLGKFDGLPYYYKEWMPETHRSHVEMYTIRDSIINNSDPLNRQTSALLIDSGVPQIDIDSMGKDMDVTISYEGDGLFDTTGESESSTNYLSNLGYNNPTEFGYTNMVQYFGLPKFIYHGKGIFSLGFVGFNPDLEYGRIYAITNDPSTYENNSYVDNPKPERTLARICDIPYSYIQLENIENVSPTFALDQEYIRQGASWTEECDEKIWNGLRPVFVREGSNHRFIFNANEDLDLVLPPNYLLSYYAEYTNFNRTIDMLTLPEQNPAFSFSVIQGSYDENYHVGDRFVSVIGGLSFEGLVYTMDGTSITKVYMLPDTGDHPDMNISNIPTREFVCKTTTIEGDGHGLKLLLTFTQEAWDELQPHHDRLPEYLYALKFDELGRIWVWRRRRGGTWKQHSIFIGETINDNYYDSNISSMNFKPENRTLSDVLLFNEFNPQMVTLEETWLPIKFNASNFSLESEIDIESDISDIISERYNHDETYYIPYQNGDGEYKLREYRLSVSNDDILNGYNRKLFPQYHDENTFYAYDSIAKLNCQSTFNNLLKQPDVYVYNPLLEKRNTYEEISTLGILSSSKNISWKDLYDLPTSSTMTFYNIYSYTYKNDIDVYDTFKTELSNLDRNDLIDMIKNFGDDVEPIQLEGTTNQYSIKQLIDYILQRNYYERSDTKLIANHGDDLSSIQQPYGGYVKMIETHDSDVSTNYGYRYEIKPLMFFKIDQEIKNLDGFRMYDEIGNDISEYCVILIKNKMYQMYNDNWIIIDTYQEEVDV